MLFKMPWSCGASVAQWARDDDLLRDWRTKIQNQEPDEAAHLADAGDEADGDAAPPQPEPV